MKFDKMTDEELIKLAKNGNNESLEFLIEKYKPFVRAKSRIYFIAGGDVQDIIQEGMIGLFKAIRDYDVNKEASFKGFCELCIVRQIISAVKMATRQKHQPLNSYVSFSKPAFREETDTTIEDTILESDVKNPEAMLINQEELKSMTEGIYRQLSKMEKKVFDYYIKGLTYREIATVMNKSAKAIDNALTRIKQKADLFKK